MNILRGYWNLLLLNMKLGVHIKVQQEGHLILFDSELSLDQIRSSDNNNCDSNDL